MCSENDLNHKNNHIQINLFLSGLPMTFRSRIRSKSTVPRLTFRQVFLGLVEQLIFIFNLKHCRDTGSTVDRPSVGFSVDMHGKRAVIVLLERICLTFLRGPMKICTGEKSPLAQ